MLWSHASFRLPDNAAPAAEDSRILGSVSSLTERLARFSEISGRILAPEDDSPQPAEYIDRYLDDDLGSAYYGTHSTRGSENPASRRGGQPPPGISNWHGYAPLLLHPGERWVIHVDMNCYFAQVEQRITPSLRGKPVAVAGDPDGRSVVATCSYEARARGVRTGMPVGEARRHCPELVILGGSISKYADTTRQILLIMERFSPLLEVFSIDEAFLDITPVLDRLGDPERAGRLLKRSIRRELGLTCSCGVAPNKLLAKLGSDLQKPDGLVVIYHDDVASFMEELPVRELCGIGSRLEQHLAGMGIKTCGQMGRADPERMFKRFGIVGERMIAMGRGRDDAPVVPYTESQEPKSVGHSQTFMRDLYRPGEIRGALLNLCERIGRRLRRHGLLGRCVSAAVRYSDFYTVGKQHRNKLFIDDGYEVYERARQIVEDIREPGRGVRLLAVSVSMLTGERHATSLLPREAARQRMLAATDAINDRYGEFTLGRASALKPEETEAPVS